MNDQKETKAPQPLETRVNATNPTDAPSQTGAADHASATARVAPAAAKTPSDAQPAPHTTSAMAISGLVIGILALLTSFIPIINNLSFFIALLGLVFSAIGLAACIRKTRKGKGLAIAALVICIVSCIIVLGTQSLYSAALKEATGNAASSAKTEQTVSEESTSGDSQKESTEQQASTTEETTNQEPAVIPTEYKSALRKAETYSKTMHMSKQGIYDQLTSEYGEDFSEEAAQYAIDNIDADWNENALKKAQQYQDVMAMSPSAIHDQLTSEYGEKFTQEEADFAIANLQ